MKKNIFAIYYLLVMSLLLFGCDSGQSPTSTIPVVPSSTILHIVPTPTIPVKIRSVIIEPSMVKNGDTFFLRVNASPGGLPIKADISQLDSTQKTPVILGASGGDNYSAKLTISYGNTVANGMKTLTLISANKSGETAMETIQIELRNPTPVLDEIPPNDNFDKPHLDSSKWSFNNGNGGKVNFQDSKLFISTDSQYNSQARIYSVWKFPGDFDIQVDFQNGDGWILPETEHTDAAVLGVEVDGNLYHITRLNRTKYDYNQSIMMAWNSLENISKAKSVTALTGKFRLIRTGSSLIYLYDVDDGWMELGMVTLPVSPAQVYMGIQSVYHSQVFSTYFDNFMINSGRTIH